jgi:rhodanese-related sulfurtransferase
MKRRDDTWQETGAGVPGISAREAWERLHDAEAPGAPLLVDVREAWEYEDGHAQGAVNVPLSEFRQRWSKLPRDRDLLMICHVGERSLMAARFLRQQGIERVANVEGGTDDWEVAGLPMQRGHA